MTLDSKVATGTRIDKWLWAARFYKTRSKAKAAVVGGHVQVNGSRVKAARDVHVGDRLTINRDDFKAEYVVQQLTDKRGSASVAQLMYEETDASKDRRESTKLQRQVMRGSLVKPKTKPNKADRRKLIRLKTSSDWNK